MDKLWGKSMGGNPSANPNIANTNLNPIQSNVLWQAQVVLFSCIVHYDHIQIGTLLVPVKLALKLKSTSWLDQCLSSLYWKH